MRPPANHPGARKARRPATTRAAMKIKSTHRWLSTTVFAVTIALLGINSGHGNDPDALWKLVHDKCVPDQRQNGNPAPCAVVDLREGDAKGYAVLKDLVGATQYLLIPTARVPGIESPLLLAPEAPNYFADAWRERGYTERAAIARCRSGDQYRDQLLVRALSEPATHTHRLRSDRCTSGPAAPACCNRRQVGAVIRTSCRPPLSGHEGANRYARWDQSFRAVGRWRAWRPHGHG